MLAIAKSEITGKGRPNSTNTQKLFKRNLTINLIVSKLTIISHTKV